MQKSAENGYGNRDIHERSIRIKIGGINMPVVYSI